MLRSVSVDPSKGLGSWARFDHAIAADGHKSCVEPVHNKHVEHIKNFTGVNFIALFWRVTLT